MWCNWHFGIENILNSKGNKCIVFNVKQFRRLVLRRVKASAKWLIYIYAASKHMMLWNVEHLELTFYEQTFFPRCKMYLDWCKELLHFGETRAFYGKMLHSQSQMFLDQLIIEFCAHAVIDHKLQSKKKSLFAIFDQIENTRYLY